MDNIPSLEACRICANLYMVSGDVDLLSLFEPREGLQNELVFITTELKAWQLNIYRDDGLPQRICGNCFAKFCSIYAFRTECLEAQEKLQAFVEGDCAEEVVTAQGTPLNGTLSSDVHIENAEVGLESMLAGGVQARRLVEHVAKEEELNNDMKPELIPCDELKRELLNTTAQGAPESICNEATHTMEIEAAKPDVNMMELEDLEEVLQGNYIPKSIRKEDAAPRNVDVKDEMCDSSDISSSSSIEEEDDTLQIKRAPNPLACQYCYVSGEQHLVFRTAEDLSQHFFDAHDPTFPYTCPECPQKFSSSKLRQLHVKQKHQGQYQHTMRERMCQYCGYALRGMTREEHMEQCKYLGDWECAECGLKFKQVTHFTFKSHMQREHATAKKQFKCTECGRYFAQRTLFENHLRLHAKNTVLWCNECKEAFADAYELRKHKYKTHRGELPVSCDYCNRGFVSPAFLHRHMQLVHPDKVEDAKNMELKCNNCGTEFSSLNKLRYHQQKPLDENGRCRSAPVHPKSAGIGIFSCPHCSKRFQMKTQLEKHVRSHDALGRTLKCEQCHVIFYSVSELNQHQDIAHSELNPKLRTLLCEHCDRKFAYKRDLKEHMLRHEELYAPCPDPGCGHVCKNEKLLSDHIRQKHRLLPCDYCGERFTRQRMNIHIRNVHSNESQDPTHNSDDTEDIGEVIENNVAESCDGGDGDEVGNGANADTDDDDMKPQERVVVEFLGNRATSDVNVQDHPAHQYPNVEGSIYNPFEDYAAELVIEQEHEIVVT